MPKKITKLKFHPQDAGNLRPQQDCVERRRPPSRRTALLCGTVPEHSTSPTAPRPRPTHHSPPAVNWWAGICYGVSSSFPYFFPPKPGLVLLRGATRLRPVDRENRSGRQAGHPHKVSSQKQKVLRSRDCAPLPSHRLSEFSSPKLLRGPKWRPPSWTFVL